jgi:hypothetical protein
MYRSQNKTREDRLFYADHSATQCNNQKYQPSICSLTAESALILSILDLDSVLLLIKSVSTNAQIHAGSVEDLEDAVQH